VSITTTDTVTTKKSPRGAHAARKATQRESEAEPAVFSMRAYRPPVETDAHTQGQYAQFEIKYPGLYDLTIISESEYRQLDNADRVTYKRHKHHWMRILKH
jgi:hypothetical protein